MKIKRNHVGLSASAFMAALLLTACPASKEDAEVATTNDQETPTPPDKADSTPTGKPLSPTLPFDVTVTGTKLETSIRRNFDEFSWQTFVALNWSSDPNEMIGVNGDNPTVWETWKNSADVFLEKGAKPEPWGAPGKIPAICSNEKGRMLLQVGKTPDVLNEMEQPFKTGPLIDQNSLYTRYEILMNEEMFDYIYNNDLYSFEGQQAFNKAADFPEGSNDKKVWGAIMVKAAWKIMGPGDDKKDFHTTEAIVYTPASTNPEIEESCTTETVGLVGLHIGTKTETSPQWIWSTFEHVRNAPTFGSAADEAHYNYYKSGAKMALNEAPARPWDPNIPNQIPSQVERLTPIFPGTAELNKEYQDKLRAVNPDSVWQNYELVGTQWPVHPDQKPLGDPFPLFLANSTLETYIQGIVVDDKVELQTNVSSSCMHCHNGATMISNGHPSDFTFLLERAK